MPCWSDVTLFPNWVVQELISTLPYKKQDQKQGCSLQQMVQGVLESGKMYLNPPLKLGKATTFNENCKLSSSH